MPPKETFALYLCLKKLYPNLEVVPVIRRQVPGSEATSSPDQPPRQRKSIVSLPLPATVLYLHSTPRHRSPSLVAVTLMQSR